ncbi:MAG: hypothetical protein DRO12_04185 [Thermoprotei archaeon]|nr:MAG: hypothetical protein DRO12_04185 [Thermoprotei archaeon]
MKEDLKFVVAVLRKLIIERHRYFDKYERLNSDGRKLLERALRYLIKHDHSKKRIVKKVRRRATLDEVLRLVEALEGYHARREVVNYLRGPYSYELNSVYDCIDEGNCVK